MISKPREIASSIRKQKFGSADNIPSQLRDSITDETHRGSEKISSGDKYAIFLHAYAVQ